jgi:hypothetical protein
MKQITVTIVGAKCQPLDIQISEGATVGGILSALDMEDDLLVKEHYASQNFYNEEGVYEQVSDGNQLYVLTNVRYGC